MKVSLRLIALLATGITIVTIIATWNEVRSAQLLREIDLHQRAEILAGRLQDIVEPRLRQGSLKHVAEDMERFSAREHLAGVGIYDAGGKLLTVSSTYFEPPDARPAAAPCVPSDDAGCGELVTIGDRPIYLYSIPFHRDHGADAVMTTFNDASDISARSALVWRSALLHVVPQILLVVLVTLG